MLFLCYLKITKKVPDLYHKLVMLFKEVYLSGTNNFHMENGGGHCINYNLWPDGYTALCSEVRKQYRFKPLWKRDIESN